MEKFDYLVAGGGVAGVSAAEEIRKQDPAARIALVSGEQQPLYSRVLLPHYVKGLVRRDAVFLRTVERYAAAGITVLAGDWAVRLDAAGRTLHLKSGAALVFEKFVIATGGTPLPLMIPGAQAEGVSRFQTIQDADAMVARLPTVKRAAVVGSSFIALEYLAILCKFGIPAALVVRGPHVFNGFLDPDGAAFLEAHFRKQGVGPIVRNDRLVAIESHAGAVRAIRTERGERIEADFVGVGIGLGRDTAWLLDSGVAIGTAGVRADAYLETNVPGVFAAGDAAELVDPLTGRSRAFGNWSHATLSGKLAGHNAARPDQKSAYDHISVYSIQHFGYSIAVLGDTGAPGGAAIAALDRDTERYGRFFLHEGRLVGAVLINRNKDQAALVALMKSRQPIANAEEFLARPNADLAALAAA
ncbi:NAD(P)/FAD-dependent oxidoreductase [Candidatus Parcubacteria bacterium]|nr:MAG: NAD(P)/FAD-dependent oxidoreductase [Candidatus Parcubacteria bacterium]